MKLSGDHNLLILLQTLYACEHHSRMNFIGAKINWCCKLDQWENCLHVVMDSHFQVTFLSLSDILKMIGCSPLLLYFLVG